MSDLLPFYRDAENVYYLEFNKGIRPDPSLLVWQWADSNREMPKGYPEPGPYRTSRTPYLREIMEILSPSHPCEEACVMKGTQLGFTEVINNWFLCVADLYPGPAMMVLPTIALAQGHSKKKLRPSIKTVPALRNKIRDIRSRDSSSTTLYKEFPGGSITLAGANSAASFRSDSIRYMALDDIDGYPPDVDGEGDPCDLAMNRLDAYSNRKILKVSTPTVSGVSRIQLEYEDSDQRKYYVPCPFCKHEQPLEWGGKDADFGIKFKRDGQVVKDAMYLCKRCHNLIPEYQKTFMLANGLWVPHNPGHPKRGYWLPSYNSPLGWVSWKKIASEFLAAKDNPARLKRWTNTRDGKPFEHAGTQANWRVLKSRAEPYPLLLVPSKGLFLTASCDVQDDRLEPMIVAWGRGEECWIVYSGAIFENPGLDLAWDMLDALLSRAIEHAGRVSLSIKAVAVDSGGHHTQRVYNECRKRPNRWMAVKGSSIRTAPILGRPTAQDVNFRGKMIKGGVHLWPVGVHHAKELIYDRYEIKEPGPGFIHLPDSLDESFFKQLCAEKLVTKFTKGFPVKEWVKPSQERNEALDNLVYAYAAAIRAGLLRMTDAVWDELEASLQVINNEPKEAERDHASHGSKVIRSNWIGRG